MGYLNFGWKEGGVGEREARFMKKRSEIFSSSFSGMNFERKKNFIKIMLSK